MDQPIRRRRARRASRPELDRTARRYYVYRLLDAAGATLYIGRSCAPLQRLSGHHAASDWARNVIEVQAWGPFTWDTAVRFERKAILRERPPHNIDGVTKNTGRLAAVEGVYA